MRNWQKNGIAICIGIFIALLLAELILHIYNPFQSRGRGNKIVLPANVKYEFSNIKINGLDSHIIHRKNSLGFRGPELPADKKTVKIFCVGGSTTECFYLSDGYDWPAMLMKKMKSNGQNVWINNAGLDGHSTFGHIILLRDYLLKYKPDYILFLVGCNDVAADGLNLFEGYHLSSKKRFLENFELFNLYQSWRRSSNANKMGMGHKPVDFFNWPKADTLGWEKSRDSWNTIPIKIKKLAAYYQRLDTLKTICMQAGIKPVFITQPSILSNHTDPITGRYLGDLLFQGNSGLHYQSGLEKYNDQIRLLQGRMMDANLNKFYWTIDAAKLLESSTLNYYDFFHYTKTGAENMANIIFETWAKHIEKEKQ